MLANMIAAGTAPAVTSSMMGPAGMPAPGLSPGAMAGLGIGSYLLGTGMDFLGQREGAKALEAESARQAAEQDLYARNRNAKLMEALGRFNPQGAVALSGANAMTRLRASTPALAGAGAALGTNPALAGQALLPAQTLASQRVGADAGGDRNAQDMQRLQGELGRMDENNQMVQATYDPRSAAAGNAGAGMRLAGKNFQMGLPLLGLAMARPAA